MQICILVTLVYTVTLLVDSYKAVAINSKLLEKLHRHRKRCDDSLRLCCCDSKLGPSSTTLMTPVPTTCPPRILMIFPGITSLISTTTSSFLPAKEETKNSTPMELFICSCGLMKMKFRPTITQSTRTILPSVTSNYLKSTSTTMTTSTYIENENVPKSTTTTCQTTTPTSTTTPCQSSTMTSTSSTATQYTTTTCQPSTSSTTTTSTSTTTPSTCATSTTTSSNYNNSTSNQPENQKLQNIMSPLQESIVINILKEALDMARRKSFDSKVICRKVEQRLKDKKRRLEKLELHKENLMRKLKQAREDLEEVKQAHNVAVFAARMAKVDAANNIYYQPRRKKTNRYKKIT